MSTIQENIDAVLGTGTPKVTKVLQKGLLEDIVAIHNSEIVIASYYATQKQKDSADYVCDGVSDEVQINAAIQSFPILTGGKIHLTSGRFNIGATILVDRRVSIVGEGSGLAFYKEGDPENDADLREGTTTLRASANINVITVESAESTVAGVSFRDFLIQGYDRKTEGNVGIKFVTRTDVAWINNINTMDCFIGMELNDVDAANIIGCSFQWGSLGIYISSGGGSVGTAATTISNCTIADNLGIETFNSELIDCGGIAISEAYFVTISNCRFARNDRNGANPVVTFTPRNNISLLNTSIVNITDNQFWSFNGNGIGVLGIFDGASIVSTAKFTKISGNHFSDYGDKDNADTKRNGVYIKGGNITMISDNFFVSPFSFAGTQEHRPLYAVYEDGASGEWWGNTIVMNNIIYNHLAGTSDKLLLKNASSISQGNIIKQI